MVRKTELVATTEYPKWDVHEWRKQRDILLLGEVIKACMENLAPAVAKRRLQTRGLSLKSFSMSL